MKAISLMQPWAWMMTHGLPGIPMKDIENRKWQTRFRGPVLVHASKTWDKENFHLSSLLKGQYYRPEIVPPPKKYHASGFFPAQLRNPATEPLRPPSAAGPSRADQLVGADGAWSRVRPVVSGAVPTYVGVTSVETFLFDGSTRHRAAAEAMGPCTPTRSS